MNLKKILQKFPCAYKLARAAYMRFLQRQIAAPLAGKQSVFFVQVGSNDGVQGDPIHRLIAMNPHWRSPAIASGSSRAGVMTNEVSACRSSLSP